MKRLYPILFFTAIVSLFFFQFFSKGLLPIPTDTITGLYHPFRDFYAKEFPNGMPYDNSLITDPIRQQYPWRELGITVLKQGSLPLWNPYSFAGTPLIGNFQSAVFYPLNVLFVILPFSYAWSILILLQPLLAGIFMFYYLRFFKLHSFASFLGGIVFAFSGFATAWMEWGTILQTGLWLPLVLLAKEHLLQRRTMQWMIILVTAEASMFFAGHLQTFFYACILSIIYLAFRLFQTWNQEKRSNKKIFQQLITFTTTSVLVLVITAIQWIPTSRFILLSARELDQINWQREGWFLPWQHLIQFVAPDFFGNPATLNYWGIWNYGEFVGYIGIIPLIFAVYALLQRRDKKTLFSLLLLIVSLLLVLPTFIAQLPFILHIPFLSSSQPTRLIFIIDFVLAFLSALGLDYYLKEQKKIFLPLGFVLLVLSVVWLVVLKIIPGVSVDMANLATAKRNLYLPTIFMLSSLVLLFPLFSKKSKRFQNVIIIFILCITIFDLFRFFNKFNAFADKTYLYPQTKTIAFLQKQQKPFRVMSLDPRILPPNFSSIYQIETVEGYDPLYLRRYGEFITALERDRPDISGPLGFNRIITPRNYNSSLIDLLNVKYVLSLNEITSSKLKKVFEEGQTKVYENINVIPRVFFAKKVDIVANKNETISLMLQPNTDLSKHAFLDNSDGMHYNTPAMVGELPLGSVLIKEYSENRVILETELSEEGYLVLMDSFYPSWKAVIDPGTENEFHTAIFLTNYAFRGILVPQGKHIVQFYNTLL